MKDKERGFGTIHSITKFVLESTTTIDYRRLKSLSLSKSIETLQKEFATKQMQVASSFCQETEG